MSRNITVKSTIFRREKLQLINDNLTGKLAIFEAKYKESLEAENQLKKENSDLRQKLEIPLKDKNMNLQTMEKIQKENSELNVKLCQSVQVLEQANAEHDKLQKKGTIQLSGEKFVKLLFYLEFYLNFELKLIMFFQ